MIQFVQTHPVLAVVLASVLTSLTNDLNAYRKFRIEHPGASYDFVVVMINVAIGALGPLGLALAASGAMTVAK